MVVGPQLLDVADPDGGAVCGAEAPELLLSKKLTADLFEKLFSVPWAFSRSAWPAMSS